MRMLTAFFFLFSLNPPMPIPMVLPMDLGDGVMGRLAGVAATVMEDGKPRWELRFEEERQERCLDWMEKLTELRKD